MMKKMVMAMVMAWVLSAVTAGATMLDLTSAGASGYINGAYFAQISNQSTGTDNINTFVRIKAKGIERGYNTGAHFPPYDAKKGPFTHNLLLSDVPVVTIGGTDYRQFLLDINQKDSSPLLSLDSLRFYVSNRPSAEGPAFFLGKEIYNLDAGKNNWITLNAGLNSGSGSGDMFAYIPDSLFDKHYQYVYLYSKFGLHNRANGGYEEWATIRAPHTPVPLPGAVWLLGAGFLGLIKIRRKSTSG